VSGVSRIRLKDYNEQAVSVNRSTPDIQHHPRALLEQLDLRRALNLSMAALGLTEDPRQNILDLLRHCLRVAADVDVALAIQDRIGDLSTIVPDKILHVDLAAVGTVLLAGECDVHVKFTAELLLVLWPLLLVQEILVVAAAAVEQRDATPVLESVCAVLLK